MPKSSSFLRTCLLLSLACTSLEYLTVVHAATEYNRYLAHVFQKYGSGDIMTFEGLEHLMYNLGLGGIEFEPQHTIDEHRPNNLKPMENEQKFSKLNEETNKKLRETISDDIPIFPPKNSAQNSWDINDSSDVLIKDRNLAKKGIILEFREMHDPKHRHPREKSASFDVPPKSLVEENVCLSPQDVLRLVVNHDDLHKRKLYKTVIATTSKTGEAHDDPAAEQTHENANNEHNTEAEYIDFINNVHLTPLAFMKLCPALLVQIDQHVCARAAPLKHIDDTKEALWNAWIYASCSIFILSACGLLGIALVPLMETVAYKEILKFLVAVAVGTLSGDALMHLLPHALVQEHADKNNNNEEVLKHTDSAAGHSHDNTPVWICACAFAAAVFMYILEHLLPFLRGQTGEHEHSHGHGHSHGKKIHEHHTHHTHSKDNAKHKEQPIKVDEKNTSIPIESAIATSTTTTQSTADLKEIRELNVMLNEAKLDKKMSKSRPLTPVAFMVIIGDGLHNLTDGLAIGAAFATDPVTGLATAFAVLCHELPHELGDFALLLQTGVSIRRAVYLNIVSSVLSFLGMAIGLLIAGLHSNMTQWIYAGTAGSFLYIAFADLIPAMSEDGKRNVKNVLIQISGIIVGGVIMIIIAVNEERLEELFQ